MEEQELENSKSALLLMLHAYSIQMLKGGILFYSFTVHRFLLNWTPHQMIMTFSIFSEVKISTIVQFHRNRGFPLSLQIKGGHKYEKKWRPNLPKKLTIPHNIHNNLLKIPTKTTKRVNSLVISLFHKFNLEGIMPFNNLHIDFSFRKRLITLKHLPTLPLKIFIGRGSFFDVTWFRSKMIDTLHQKNSFRVQALENFVFRIMQPREILRIEITTNSTKTHRRNISSFQHPYINIDKTQKSLPLKIIGIHGPICPTLLKRSNYLHRWWFFYHRWFFIILGWKSDLEERK